MILIAIVQVAALIAAGAAASVAPWWAAPVEHVAIAFFGFLGLGIQPAVTIWQSRKTRAHVDVKRLESQGEHRRNGANVEEVRADVEEIKRSLGSGEVHQ